MAAQAQGDVEVGIGSGEAGQRLGVTCARAGAAEDESLADQRGHILAPQGNVARGGISCFGAPLPYAPLCGAWQAAQPRP